MIANLLHEIFPEGISDETAYHLIEFFMHLSSELDVHYFPQAKRYRENHFCMDPLVNLQHKKT